MSWTLIESQTLSSSIASVTLGNGGTIPQSFKTLKLVISSRTTTGAAGWADVTIKPNGSASNLTDRFVYGSGSGTASSTGTTWVGWSVSNGSTANTFSSNEITFPNYSSSSNKPISIDAVTEQNATAALQIMHAGLWSNSAAITSLQLTSSGGTDSFAAGSTFTLYGLR